MALTCRELADIVDDECFRRAEIDERLEGKKVRLDLEV